MKRIYDPEFKYVPSHMTDIRVLFKRVRREMLESLTPEKTRVMETTAGKRRTEAA